MCHLNSLYNLLTSNKSISHTHSKFKKKFINRSCAQITIKKKKNKWHIACRAFNLMFSNGNKIYRLNHSSATEYLLRWIPLTMNVECYFTCVSYFIIVYNWLFLFYFIFFSLPDFYYFSLCWTCLLDIPNDDDWFVMN